MLIGIKCSPKSVLQIEESTDVAGLAQLLVFVRYCFGENIQEAVMFRPQLSERCTGNDIFKAVNDYFTAEDNFLGKLRRHLYRRSSSCDRTQERLSSAADWYPRELYTFYHS
jgi:hypothetical protein